MFWKILACFETVIKYQDDYDYSNYATKFFLETPGDANSIKLIIWHVYLLML